MEKGTCFNSSFETRDNPILKKPAYHHDIDLFTCREVMDPLCPCSTATGAQVRRHHTRMVLSQLPAAMSVFS